MRKSSIVYFFEPSIDCLLNRSLRLLLGFASDFETSLIVFVKQIGQNLSGFGLVFGWVIGGTGGRGPPKKRV